MTDKPSTPHKLTLLVDFDGVLHSYDSGWQGATTVLDGPVPGAIQFLWDATERFLVCIYSSRSSSPGGVEAMMAAIDTWERAYVTNHAKTRPPHLFKTTLSEALLFPTTKPGAFLTIDDRCVQFNGVFPPIQELLDFKPWNKR